mmetsp:Transcript_40966/g.73383  ORF Transcript_40966/g.73383 Transcript_40966/m.73383 type:complete len:757 (-) Transcript_40966:13-2283(-)
MADFERSISSEDSLWRLVMDDGSSEVTNSKPIKFPKGGQTFDGILNSDDQQCKSIQEFESPRSSRSWQGSSGGLSSILSEEDFVYRRQRGDRRLSLSRSWPAQTVGVKMTRWEQIFQQSSKTASPSSHVATCLMLLDQVLTFVGGVYKVPALHTIWMNLREVLHSAVYVTPLNGGNELHTSRFKNEDGETTKPMEHAPSPCWAHVAKATQLQVTKLEQKLSAMEVMEKGYQDEIRWMQTRVEQLEKKKIAWLSKKEPATQQLHTELKFYRASSGYLYGRLLDTVTKIQGMTPLKHLQSCFSASGTFETLPLESNSNFLLDWANQLVACTALGARHQLRSWSDGLKVHSLEFYVSLFGILAPIKAGSSTELCLRADSVKHKLDIATKMFNRLNLTLAAQLLQGLAKKYSWLEVEDTDGTDSEVSSTLSPVMSPISLPNSPSTFTEEQLPVEKTLLVVLITAFQMFCNPGAQSAEEVCRKPTSSRDATVMDLQQLDAVLNDSVKHCMHWQHISSQVVLQAIVNPSDGLSNAAHQGHQTSIPLRPHAPHAPHAPQTISTSTDGPASSPCAYRRPSFLRIAKPSCPDAPSITKSAGQSVLAKYCKTLTRDKAVKLMVKSMNSEQVADILPFDEQETIFHDIQATLLSNVSLLSKAFSKFASKHGRMCVDQFLIFCENAKLQGSDDPSKLLWLFPCDTAEEGPHHGEPCVTTTASSHRADILKWFEALIRMSHAQTSSDPCRTPLMLQQMIHNNVTIRLGQ